MKQFFTIVVLACLCLGWGSKGHLKINQSAILSFDPQLKQFMNWSTTLANHASDADNRKSTDPTEDPKHYIDIDNYPDFKTKHRIPETLDSVNLLYGKTFATTQGILPWATLVTFDSLTNCFKRRDWEKAALFAADLGHYVADGHMPLHITSNYDGQNTNQKGIHSRYETTMINKYVQDINYTGEALRKITDVKRYVFDYLYKNYPYMDSVLIADTYATKLASSTSSAAYTDALWSKSKIYTTMLFKNASVALSELIYAAWIKAGSPQIIQTFVENQDDRLIITPAYPNPFHSSVTISFELKEFTPDLEIKIIDCKGQNVDVITKGSMQLGIYKFDWKPQSKQAEIFYCFIKTNKNIWVRKLVYLN